MADERDFKVSDFIKQPITIALSQLKTDNFSSPMTDFLKNKIKTFSKLITDVDFKKAFDEYFKEFI